MGKRGPKPGQAYGAAAIASVFKGVDFPLSKQDIMSKYGSNEIEYTKGHTVKIKDVLKNVPSSTFDSPADLEHAFHEEMQ